MALNSASIEKTGAFYGFLTGVAFIIYSLIMKYGGLIDVLAARGVYVVIMAVGVSMAIASLKKGREGRLNYLQGIGVGAITSIVSSLLFSLVVLIMIEFVDESFINIVKSDAPQTEHSTVLDALLIITMAGFVGGTFLAYIAMMWFKRPDHKMTK